ncbi:MAG: NAD-dependent epimerase/dehydratase family protein [Chitinophagaceae bacterium]
MHSAYLLTGASGFLGKYLAEHLASDGDRVVTLGRSAAADIVCNLSTGIPKINTQVEVVVHAAGKAHIVPKTEAEKQDFFDVNYQGTVNLCKGLEALPVKPKAFVFISTVAVYGVDAGENISEKAVLNGNTPYAKSKIAAEEFLQHWCLEHGVLLSTLRLPLIAGSRPPGNLGAMITGLQDGKYFNISGGHAKKSVVMASDIAVWIPVIAGSGGTYNLTDGYHPSFAELAAIIAQQLGKSSPKNIPGWLATMMGWAGNLLGNKAPINSNKLQKITATLTFDDSHARKAFGWKPQPVLEAFRIV